ncbi:pirin family protein [Spirochaetota bacterium]
MQERQIGEQVRGFRTKDGAGVSLVRVLGTSTVKSFDPILLLDSFDSVNPDEYLAGFPLHPHRGIETISYIYRGKMTHKDSLGNEDTISDGEVQWMTAGSGILHEERLPASDRMLGVQLWLNLPAKDKMTHPSYHAIKNADIEEFGFDGGFMRILAGSYKDKQGYKAKYLPLDYYDIHLEADASVSVDVKEDASVMVFTLVGDVYIGSVLSETNLIKEKTAAKLSRGDLVNIRAGSKNAQLLFMSSEYLAEEIAWGGPIVMNTEKELQKAFSDLRSGTFLQEGISY